MKAKFAARIAALAFLLGPLTASAQSYSIDWYKIAGGGGTSTGGAFSLSGTIGQHDASAPAPASGGSFSLLGGYWALYIVPTPGAPTLCIKLTSTNTAIVYWPSASTGWIIQCAVHPSTGNWAAPVETTCDNGTVKYIVVNQPLGNRFYRLKSQ